MNRRWTAGLVMTIVMSAGGAAAAAPLVDPPAQEVCVGLMLPSVTGAAGDATAVASAIRDLLVSYLAGPSVRPVVIEARLTSLALEEARAKACGHVLVVKMTQRQGGGGGMLGRTIGRAAQSAAWYAPSGSTAAAVARGGVTSGGEALSALSESTKAKDEFRVEHTLLRTDGAGPAPAPSENAAKAKRDGRGYPHADRRADRTGSRDGHQRASLRTRHAARLT